MVDRLNASVLRVAGRFYPQRSGHAVHVTELSQRIQPYLENQVILAPKVSGDYQEFDRKFGIPIYRVESSLLAGRDLPGAATKDAFYYAVNIVSQVKALLREGKTFDLIHVHGILLGQFIEVLLRANRISLPMVVMSHGAPVVHLQPRATRSALRGLESFLLRHFKPDYFIQLDDGNLDPGFLRELHDIGIPVRIVSHAIDTDLFRPDNSPRPSDEFVILSNHRLVPFKRVDLTILAFKQCLEEVGYDRKIRLRLLGSGSLRSELESLVRREGLGDHVDFAGERPAEEMRSELVSAGVVVGTSLISNINRSIQEAMACGRPVIIFDSGANDNFFIHMENAVLVPPGDTRLFSEGLRQLYEDADLRARLGKNARETIQEKKNWDVRLTEELDVYRCVMKSSVGASPGAR